MTQTLNAEEKGEAYSSSRMDRNNSRGSDEGKGKRPTARAYSVTPTSANEAVSISGKIRTIGLRTHLTTNNHKRIPSHHRRSSRSNRSIPAPYKLDYQRQSLVEESSIDCFCVPLLLVQVLERILKLRNRPV